jgi:hypothetical protein
MVKDGSQAKTGAAPALLPIIPLIGCNFASEADVQWYGLPAGLLYSRLARAPRENFRKTKMN